MFQARGWAVLSSYLNRQERSDYLTAKRQKREAQHKYDQGGQYRNQTWARDQPTDTSKTAGAGTGTKQLALEVSEHDKQIRTLRQQMKKTEQIIDDNGVDLDLGFDSLPNSLSWLEKP